jgi:hypothetical protein
VEAAQPARVTPRARNKVAQGNTVILRCHWLSFRRNLHTNLAVIAVIFSQNDSVGLGYNKAKRLRRAHLLWSCVSVAARTFSSAT